MVAGESGLGKTTLVKTLLNESSESSTVLYQPKKKDEILSLEERCARTTQIERYHLDLDDVYPGTGKLHLQIVDTPGFQDAVNGENCWQPISDHLVSTFEKYFRDENGLNRKNLVDDRVHCCLYFINPYGRGLRPLDIAAMRALQNKVNIIPLIPKADIFTATELSRFKARLMQELHQHRINVYHTPECDSDEDEEYKKLDAHVKAGYPFAIIGSTSFTSSQNGKLIRARKYPWGVVDVSNTSYCDLDRLRTMLFRTHMQDLKDTTGEMHYEEYRRSFIATHISKRSQDGLSQIQPPPMVSLYPLLINNKNGNERSNSVALPNAPNHVSKQEEMQRMRSASVQNQQIQ